MEPSLTSRSPAGRPKRGAAASRTLDRSSAAAATSASDCRYETALSVWTQSLTLVLVSTSNAELDPAYGETALATYQELLGRFPGTPAAGRAQLRILELLEMFAEKDYRNGVFYFRLHAYDSAIIYFKEVLLRYPQSSFASQSVVRLIEAYDRIGYDDEKREMCLHLEQYYPGTEGAEEWCAAP